VCAPAACRAVIIGKFPYADPMEATGLAFSKQQARPDGTLIHLFNHLQSDAALGFYGRRPPSCDLTPWSTREGVLLLNASLQGQKERVGQWKPFLANVIRRICASAEGTGVPCGFVLLGAEARALSSNISGRSRQCVVESAFPSAWTKKDFNDARPFATLNEKLERFGAAPIAWNVIAE